MIVLFFMASLAFSQPTDLSRPAFTSLQQSGNLFSLRLSPGKPLKIFVVGREEAKVDLNQLKISVRRLAPYPGEELSVQRTGDYFTVKNAPVGSKSEKLEVRTQLNELEEVFRFQVPPKP